MDALAIPPELAAADLLDDTGGGAAWRLDARPEQIPPDGPWSVFLVMAGRGWGKTWLGARWLAERALAIPGDYCVVGRSTQDTREVCVEGSSGLLRALGLQRGDAAYNAQTGRVILPNGSKIFSYSAESPDWIRGSNLSGCWMDEAAGLKRIEEIWGERSRLLCASAIRKSS